MKKLNANIPIGLGDLIYIKAMLEPVKHNFSEINLTFHRELIDKYKKESKYNDFLDEFGKLLFNEEPYKLCDQSFPFCSLSEFVTAHRIMPQKPELAHLLCDGYSLNLKEPYIVINTKIRSLPHNLLDNSIREFWTVLNQLSQKYLIVILGERVIEMNEEYMYYTQEYIYSLYPHILNNVPKERLLDLTVPALGITTPDIKNIQHDCSIMNQAAVVINFGIGGGFCLATAVANVVGYRYDDDLVANLVFDGKIYSNATITKNWELFITALGHYL